MATEKPILFSGSMVRAILEGRKTMTRRVVKPQPDTSLTFGDTLKMWTYDPHGKPWMALAWRDTFTFPGEDLAGAAFFPYGQPGDLLWVRETFALFGDAGGRWFKAGIPKYNCGKPTGWVDFPYKLDSTFDPPSDLKWRPSIFMPRWASRLTLRVTNVRVERLQDISEDDAKAEGIDHNWLGSIESCPEEYQDEWCNYLASIDGFPCYSAQESFMTLWQSINAKRPGCAWDDNPWVWVVEFERVN